MFARGALLYTNMYLVGVTVIVVLVTSATVAGAVVVGVAGSCFSVVDVRREIKRKGEGIFALKIKDGCAHAIAAAAVVGVDVVNVVANF